MVQPSTLKFLSALKRNNNREWFEVNKQKYLDSLADFTQTVEELISRISQFDQAVAHVDPKKCLFRIYRDVRFSKDKTPYKSHFGAFITANGKNSAGPGYYIHLAPGECFLGGGLYQPSPEVLQRIREAIASDPTDINAIIQQKEFKKTFGGFWQEDALKTAPKGFPKDHPAINLLKLRHFIGDHQLTDEDVLDKKFEEKIAKIFSRLGPLNEWLGRYVD